MCSTPRNPAQEPQLPVPFAGVFPLEKESEKSTLYFVEKTSETALSIRPLNAHLVPSGATQAIEERTLLEKYSPEPGIYMARVAPQIRKMEEHVDKGDRHREKGEHYSAELEYDSALAIDEDHIRANFGLGLSCLEIGCTDRAEKILGKLVELEASFQPEHKHLFNEFGIQLRKSGLYTACCAYYERALSLTDSDENLLFNHARALFENEHYAEAQAQIDKALKLAPDFSEAALLRDYITKKQDKSPSDKKELSTPDAG
ncbi:hypothetical protein LWC08_09430 [Desulfobaculum bizertense]|uniref:hypothetical protein n=1 Tax=Desulfobaculum bizertense TaxID=376490 RepID=UPI001F1C7090|nr:hypothetical protein [Desulfobaculum bizertense]UIJ36959.1 hypothetical protein LWC08_09430 [Desulfobaculum bizertense]